MSIEATRTELWRLINDFEDNLKRYGEIRGDTLVEENNIGSVDSLLMDFGLDPTHVRPSYLLKKELINAKPGPISKGVSHASTATSLLQLGVETRHLPLYRFVTSSSKFIPTDIWIFTRDELIFSHCFDRITELRHNGEWSFSHSSSNLPSRPQNGWDFLLEEMWFVSKDFQEERRWKQNMAKNLAEEAVNYKKKQSSSLSNGNFYKQNYEMLNTIMESHIVFPTLGDEMKDYRLIKNPIRNTNQYEFMDFSSFATTQESDNGSSLDWSPSEDSMFASLSKRFLYSASALKTIANILNHTFHSGRPVRSSQNLISRHSSNSRKMVDNIDFHSANRHLDKMGLMNSSSTKLVATKPTVMPKKLNMNAHPSHEAAARKANLNISKLFTPQELAMRRIQRTRIITDPSGAIMSAPLPSNTAGILRQQSIVGMNNPPGHIRPSHPQAAAYQVAIAAASARGSTGSVSSLAALPRTPGPAIARPNPSQIPNAIIAQQQRQALLNRSQQIGSYISSMNQQQQQQPLIRPTQSPLLRPQSQMDSLLPSESVTNVTKAVDCHPESPVKNESISPRITRRSIQK